MLIYAKMVWKRWTNSCNNNDHTYICICAINFYHDDIGSLFLLFVVQRPIIISLRKQIKNSQGISSTCVSVVLGHVVFRPSQDSLLTLIGFVTYLSVLFVGPHVADQAVHCWMHSTVSHSPKGYH